MAFMGGGQCPECGHYDHDDDITIERKTYKMMANRVDELILENTDLKARLQISENYGKGRDVWITKLQEDLDLERESLKAALKPNLYKGVDDETGLER